MPTDQTQEDVAKSHRWHAAECNNLAWSLSELRNRSLAQDAEMLNTAHASAYHWSKVGNELTAARSNMLLGHVHAALANGTMAMRYAQQSYDFFAAKGDTADWERAFAHAVLAHAATACGETERHRAHHAEAERIGRSLTDPEDREIFFKTFGGIPRP